MERSLEVIYVARPFSAPTPEGVEANVMAAVAFGQEVRTTGFIPLVPHVAILPIGNTEAE